MNKFSISQLQQFSGIKAHTIRMWESRYKALTPIRSKGNTRYYDNIQLRRLLNIVSLLNSEYKISELCAMTDEELYKILESRLKEDKPQDELSAYFVSQLIAAGMSYDEAHFEKIFSTMVLKFGIINGYVNVIYPLLVRIGLMWTRDTMLPSQEHFISNLIRQKLFTAIDALPPALENADSWMLFLPENEFHELGLLFSHYLLRHAGRNVIYLGSNVPYNTLHHAVARIKPTHMLLFLVHNDEPEVTQEYVSNLSKDFNGVQIYLAGYTSLVTKLDLPSNFRILKSSDELQQMID
jgi:MerR family transcriptional regulator, light-induced transcriptional regulator